MSLEKFKQLIDLPKQRVLEDPLELLAHGTDASFYRLIPQLVVKAENEQQIIRLMNAARECGLSLTFRTAGTSLSGQAVSDSVLVKLGHDWKEYRISDDGSRMITTAGDHRFPGQSVAQALRP